VYTRKSGSAIPSQSDSALSSGHGAGGCPPPPPHIDYEDEEDDPLTDILADDAEDGGDLEERLDSPDPDTWSAAWQEVAASLTEMDPVAYPELSLPARPTQFPGGSAAKRQLCRERLANGLTPCHPQDSPPDPPDDYRIINTRSKGSVRRRGLRRKPK
jgi:hypothetical protein